jgi:transcriptional regulator with XRE-family HTH domain
MNLRKITPIDQHLAKKLRQFRLSCGISQDRLGELSGLTFQQIQKYEMAQNRIPASRLFEFSQILQRPFSDFFSDIKADRMYYNYDFESEKKLQKKSGELEKEILPLIAAYKNIEDDQARKNLVAIAASLAQVKQKKVKHYYS